tara:strand:+ start:45 stop:656 length:612 start_codon:yes stop_codon:yes gene_type:complete
MRKKIIFLGDSITRHYFNDVRGLLNENEVDADIPVPWMSQQPKQMRYLKNNKDILLRNSVSIHFNFGLHSIKLPKKGHDPNVRRAPKEWFETYERQLSEIIDYMKEIQISNILFSNTTPSPKNYGMRKDPDVVILNEIASRITSEKQIPYNDLYSYVKEHSDYPRLYRHPRRENNVHFNPVGCKYLSKSLAKFVLENLREKSI